MPRIDSDALLLSRANLHVDYEPMCTFCADDYLPRDVYDELYATWPHEASVDYSANTEGKFGFRSSEAGDAFARFCDTHPVWGEVVDILSSEAFSDDVQRTLARGLVDARGAAARRRWRNDTHRAPSDNPLRYWLSEPMRTTFQISVLPPGKTVDPHLDAPRKLVSLLLYFADPDWRPEWGGATEFYVPVDPERARTWSPTARVGFEEMKLVRETAFVPNRLAGFVRSPTSWHGVRPIACPEGRGRKALLINLKRLKWSKRHEP
ncbi:MAG: 2OG-Fe(II) oxygenase [Myxococcota bacterium]